MAYLARNSKLNSRKELKRVKSLISPKKNRMNDVVARNSIRNLLIFVGVLIAMGSLVLFLK